MKRGLLFLLFFWGSWVYAYDFKVPNEDGFELCYTVLSDSTVALSPEVESNSWDSAVSNYNYIICDTLHLPEKVVYNGKKYTLIKMDHMALANVRKTKKLYFSRTISTLAEHSNSGIAYYTSFDEYIVDKQNPVYETEDGVLYTKGRKTLVQYPPSKVVENYFVADGVEHIGNWAFWTNNVKNVEMPLSLKTVGAVAFSSSSIEQIVFKDSLTSVGGLGLGLCYNLRKLVFGNMLESVYFDYIAMGRPVVVENRTKVPPVCFVNASKCPYIGTSTLLVPRQSLSAYQQAEGWKEFGTILPIEPPIVAGVDTAEVSWVQNFSATGYVWTLYTDEAKTQRFMSLTFDASGHLTHIDINSGHLPTRMPALYNEGVEGEKRFAEYYSFTISGLSPDTKYYYTRQSLKGTEVIDEESGSFETLSDETEGLNNYKGEITTPQKFFENGQVFIQHGKTIYMLQGIEMRGNY